MEPAALNPRGARITDQELRDALQAGLKPAEIARRFEVSRGAISQRVKRLDLTTTTAAVAPAESQRFVRSQLDARSQLERGLTRVNKLMDACDLWLQDANDPDAYDIGARSDEVMVTWIDYSGEKPAKKKDSLFALLARLEGRFDVVGAESKHADPRELILKTVQEGRQTVTAAADLAKLLADMQLMQQWRDTVLNAVGRAAPDVRDAIVGEIRSSLVLRGLLDGPEGSETRRACG